MKKVLLLFLLSLVIITGCDMKKLKGKIEETIENQPAENISIMQLEKYKNFSFDSVKSLNVLKYTEAGVNKEAITDREQIQREYNAISRVRVLKKTKRACEDNTTIYEFVLKDDSKVTFEFECEWLVVGNKRYEIERVK